MHRKKQRAGLAASFVVTASLSGLVACGSGGSSKTPEYTHNPPMPTTTTPVPGSASVAPSGSAEPTSQLPVAPEGFTVIKDKNGVCYVDPSGGPCEPNETCNPPAPFQVQCPK